MSRTCREEGFRRPVIINCLDKYVDPDAAARYAYSDPVYGTVLRGLELTASLWSASVPTYSEEARLGGNWSHALTHIIASCHLPVHEAASLLGSRPDLRLRFLEETARYIGMESAYDAVESGVPVHMIGIRDNA